MVTDHDGWVAAATTAVPSDRIALPAQRDADLAWLPAFGSCRLEPIPGGWLVRVLGDDRLDTSVTDIDINLADQHLPRLSVQSQAGNWSHRLSPRHAELLLLLSLNPDGLTAAELSTELFGSLDHAVAVRAEMSRLRKHLGGLLCQRPYRFADWAHVHVTRPALAADLLPASTAPTIRRLRAG